MSNMLRKMKRHSIPNITMSLKVECPKCHKSKLIPREVLQTMSEEEFKEGKLFLCDKCKIKMHPVSVEVDY